MIPLFQVNMSPDAPDRVAETLRSGYIGEGPRVQEFEEALEPILGPVLATNSCTSALDLAYHLLDLGDGDEVIVSPMTCLATTMPLALRGCKIVWADVDPRTGNINPVEVARKVTEFTDTIVCVDWAGRPCDYPQLRAAALVEGHDHPTYIPIVEDAAHAFAAPTGGDYVAWSFQAIKHLTTGDGGALKVPNYQRERARLLRWYGLDRNDSTAMRCLQQVPEPGFKYQMNDIAATIGLANLPLALQSVQQRRWNARYYNAFLPAEIAPPYDIKCSYWLYTILVPERDEFIAYMEREGVQCSQVHTRNDEQGIFAEWRTPLPGLDEFAATQVSIPVGEWLTSEHLAHIAHLVRGWCAEHGIRVDAGEVPVNA